MDKFPETIKAENKSSFSQAKKDYYTSLLRKEIYLHILNGNENDFFDINQFNKKYLNDEFMCEAIFSVVIPELQDMGWKYKVSFGGTGLFLYTTENAPAGAW